jgi:hypothetical protein
MPRPFHVVIEAPAGFAISFEQAYEALDTLDRMFIEPDGSFVWTGEESPIAADAGLPLRWQVDGELYDHGGRLAYVKLKGRAPLAVLEQLLAALGWPETPLLFQLVEQGKTFDEAQFRAWLAENDAGK